MRQYLPVIGLVGLGIGIASYESCGQPYQEKAGSTKEESPTELPYSTPTPPYSIKKQEPRTVPKSKTDPPQKTIKRQPVAPKTYYPYYPFRPTLPYLEDTVNDGYEEEEQPWYNLPPEQRNFKTLKEIEPYLNAALEARDYKAAESYLTSFQEITSPQEYDRLKKGLLYTITTNYNEYLNDVVEHCNQYDSNSVLRKVLWMNVFANAHPEVFPIPEQNAKSYLDIAGLFKKGILALDAIKYCAEKRL